MKRKKDKREKERSGGAFTVPVESIVPNPAQPRRTFADEAIMRLAESIRQHGMIQPLCVRRPEGAEGVYELVAGERRLRAAKRLGLSHVPCVLVEASSEESAHMAIIENIQREDLNMFEEAIAIGKLMKVHCLTQEKIAQKLSCSQSYVANKLRLLRLSEGEREQILEAGLSERHARALLRIKDQEARVEALKAVIQRQMNVSSTEEYIDRLVEAEKRERQREKQERKTKLVIKDVRLLYNTIDRAVETVRLSGIDVQTLRRESARDTEIVIRIPKYA
ncbi:MAG: ParB/RepB/Spo0J family partition protein [Clostridia bacterium]|nr:ParB/RepB/Spo0J family partition protein [Clostridia bacterium]